jgi:hypothetical protein
MERGLARCILLLHSYCCRLIYMRHAYRRKEGQLGERKPQPVLENWKIVEAVMRLDSRVARHHSGLMKRTWPSTAKTQCIIGLAMGPCTISGAQLKEIMSK